MPKQSKAPMLDSKERKAQLRKCQEECQARCCRYITVYLEAPRTQSDFDELSWFLAHENICVYVEDRRWHLEVQNRCKHLRDDNLCAIYEHRPAVCRDYDIEACEFPARPVHTLHFDTQEEFDYWWAKKRAREKRRRQRARLAKKRGGRKA
ncbi:MAG: YkgJ family cysteine cluster protein [Proteobacteria bacterium]|nr:YkgJ family cysteine cluster protein [Pseudomonadota bacterium]